MRTLERDVAGGLARDVTDNGPLFRILGPVEILAADGEWRGVGSAKCRTTLALLLLARGQVVPLDRLVDGLWPEEPPGRALDLVRNYVMKLRRMVPGGPERIRTRPQGYQLLVHESAIDADVFQSLVHGARAALAEEKPALARARAEEAMRMCRGPVLADVCHHGPLGGEALQLQKHLAVAEEVRIRAMLACKQELLVIPELCRKVAERPDDEVLAELLMHAHLGSGNPVKALIEFDRIRRRLSDELGVDPGSQLRALHAHIVTKSLNATSTQPH